MTTENQNNNTNLPKVNLQNGSHNSSWSKEDLTKFASVLYSVFQAQNSYGQTRDNKAVLSFWKSILEKRYSMDQVLEAIETFCLKSNACPTPSDIHKILSPEKPLITTAQYQIAYEEYKKSGYNQFTDAYETIVAYKKQEEEKHEKFYEAWETPTVSVDQLDKVNEILEGSVKKLSDV